MLHNIDGPQPVKRPRHLRSPTSAVSNAAPPVVSCEAIEQAVNESPAQYLWTLRFFQTRPDSEPSVY